MATPTIIEAEFTKIVRLLWSHQSKQQTKDFGNKRILQFFAWSQISDNHIVPKNQKAWSWSLLCQKRIRTRGFMTSLKFKDHPKREDLKSVGIICKLPWKKRSLFLTRHFVRKWARYLEIKKILIILCRNYTLSIYSLRLVAHTKIHSQMRYTLITKSWILGPYFEGTWKVWKWANNRSLAYLLLHSAVTVLPTLEKSGIWAAFRSVMPVNLSKVSVPRHLWAEKATKFM